MSVRAYVSILILGSVVGIGTVGAVVGLCLRNESAVMATAGHASFEFRTVRSLVSNSNELLTVLDVLTSESSGVFLVADTLMARCRKSLANLRRAFRADGDDLVARLTSKFNEMVDVAGAAAISRQSSGDGDRLLEQYDTLALEYLVLLDTLKQRAATVADEQSRMVGIARIRNRFVFAVLGVVLILAIFALRHWTTTRLVGPIQALTEAANDAMIGGKPFELRTDGPAEVRSLTKSITSFVGSLEQRVQETGGCLRHPQVGRMVTCLRSSRRRRPGLLPVLAGPIPR